MMDTSWRNTDLFIYLKEVDAKGYAQMCAYENAGGTLDAVDRMAKKYYEKHYRNRKRTTDVEPEEVEEPKTIEIW